MLRKKSSHYRVFEPDCADGTNHTTNNMNEYTQVGATAYQYDQNGNLTNDGVFAYAYDYENRLITAVGNGHSATYAYDPFGRRISKTVDGIVTNFIYDADRIIEERDTNGILKKNYVYGTGIDEILQFTNHATPAVYYYFYDGLGSVTDITNQAGQVVETFSYDVYGMPNQTSQIGNTRYFTGRELDEETGLYYYRARYYSPVIGRFLQGDLYTWRPNDPRLLRLKPNGSRPSALDEANRIDSLEPSAIITNSIMQMGQRNPRLLHSYLYAANSPINLVDPYGLYTWPYTWKGWAGALLMGAGGVITVSVPGGIAIGSKIFFIGLGISLWDAVEGIHATSRDARKVGNKILDRDREEWQEIDRQFNINKNRCGKKGR